MVPSRKATVERTIIENVLATTATPNDLRTVGGIPTRLDLTAFDIVCGLPYGEDSRVPDLPEMSPGTDPRVELENALLEPLADPPCVVSFSGGRDSSSVLGLAAHVARRQGLPDPIPATLLFAGADGTREDAWQELVVRNLGLHDWVKIPIWDELELVGPVATTALQHHGLLWPPNAHLHVPLLDVAAGGSLLTGLDGDGLFKSWRWQRVSDVLSCRARPELRDLARVALACLPSSAARPLFGTREAPARHHLAESVRRRAQRSHAHDSLGQPKRWDTWIRKWYRRRYLRLARQSLQMLAITRDVSLVHPMLDQRFVAAFANQGGASGPGSRTTAMKQLFGDVLPASVLARSSKAEFGDAVVGSSTRAFLRELPDALPTLLEPFLERRGLVDIARSERIPFHFYTLVHAAWLNSNRPNRSPDGEPS